MASVIVYAEDCILSGSIELGQMRLSDLLNDRTEHLLTGVVVTRLVDGSTIELPELVVAGDEIVALQTDEARGDPARRRRTRQFPLTATLGPYVVRGYFHTLPGADPLFSFSHRPVFVPLTDTWLEFAVGGVKMQPHATTLLINREAADSVETVADDEVPPPEMPVPDRKDTPRLKDFTYDVLVGGPSL